MLIETCSAYCGIGYMQLRKQAKLEGLKTRTSQTGRFEDTCLRSKKTAFMRVDRSLYHRPRAPLLSMVICAV